MRLYETQAQVDMNYATFIHMHAHTINLLMYTYTNSPHLQAYIHSCMNTVHPLHIHAHTHTHTHAHTHTCTHTNTHMHAHARTHTCTHSCVCTVMSLAHMHTDQHSFNIIMSNLHNIYAIDAGNYWKRTLF